MFLLVLATLLSDTFLVRDIKICQLLESLCQLESPRKLTTVQISQVITMLNLKKIFKLSTYDRVTPKIVLKIITKYSFKVINVNLQCCFKNKLLSASVEGSTNYVLVGLYRPISLVLIYSKLFEKLGRILKMSQIIPHLGWFRQEQATIEQVRQVS